MSSKRALRRKSCEGKTQYDTQAEAEVAARHRSRQTGQWLVPYHCRFCNRYHIGHPPARVVQSIRDKYRNKPSE